MSRSTLDSLPRSGAADADAVKRFLRHEASWATRRIYVVVLLGAALTTSAVVSLLLTEPQLPTRTRLAFGALVLLGLAWTALSAWVLTRRHSLFALQRVQAGRLAVVCTSVFTLGAAALQFTGEVSAWPAALLGLGMFVAASMVLAHARRDHEELLLLKASMERDLAMQEVA